MDDLFSVETENEPSGTTEQATPTDTPTETHHDSHRIQREEPEEEEGFKRDEHLVKIETEGDVPLLYLLVNIHSDHFYIQASDTHHSWVGVVTHRQLRQTAKKSKGSEREYVDDTQSALTGGRGSFLFGSALSPLDNSLELSWKKHLVKDNIKVFVGSVVMETHPAPGVHAKMLEHGVDVVSQSRQLIEDLRRERDRLVSERCGFIKRLQDTANLKNEVKGERERERGGREGGREMEEKGGREREGTEIIKERKKPKQNQTNVHSDQYCMHIH